MRLAPTCIGARQRQASPEPVGFLTFSTFQRNSRLVGQDGVQSRRGVLLYQLALLASHRRGKLA